VHRRLAGRLAGMILALLAVSLIAFLALATIPGDAASALIGRLRRRKQPASLRAEMDSTTTGRTLPDLHGQSAAATWGVLW
jgi:ABC-type dipeptide/oligopeptide/nickel transport system permease component